MKYLITSGCSFSHHYTHDNAPLGWIEILENKLKEKNPNLITLHTGHNDTKESINDSNRTS